VNFVNDRASPNPRKLDPNTGETLETIDWHPQSSTRSQAIFSAEGRKTFQVTFDVEPMIDGSGKIERGLMILTHASEWDAEHRGFAVYGPHPDVDRIIEYWNTVPDPDHPPNHFRVIDRRRMHRSTLPRSPRDHGVTPRTAALLSALGLIGLVALIVWKKA
jgi:hypothetical protein